jgi:hypothetical protein
MEELPFFQAKNPGKKFAQNAKKPSTARRKRPINKELRDNKFPAALLLNAYNMPLLEILASNFRANGFAPYKKRLLKANYRLLHTVQPLQKAVAHFSGELQNLQIPVFCRV